MSLAKEKEYAASTRAPKPTPRPTASKPTPTASKPTSTSSASKPQSVASKMMAQRDSRDSRSSSKEKERARQSSAPSGGITGIRRTKQQITAPPPVGRPSTGAAPSGMSKQQHLDNMALAQAGIGQIPGAFNPNVAQFMPPVGMEGSPELIRKQLVQDSLMDPSVVDEAMMFGYPMLPEFAADRSTPIMANQAEVDAAMMNGFDMGPPQFAAPYMGGKEMQSGPARMTKEGPLYFDGAGNRITAEQMITQGREPRPTISMAESSLAGAGATTPQPFDGTLSYGDMQWGGPALPQFPTYDFRDIRAMEEDSLATRMSWAEPDLAPPVSPRPTANPMASYPPATLRPPEYVPMPGESRESFERRMEALARMQDMGIETTVGLQPPPTSTTLAPSVPDGGAAEAVPTMRPVPRPATVPVAPTPTTFAPDVSPLPTPRPATFAPDVSPLPTPRPSAVPSAVDGIIPAQLPLPGDRVPVDVGDPVVAPTPVAAPTDPVPQMPYSPDAAPTTPAEGVPDTTLGLGIREGLQAAGSVLGGIGEQFGEFISNFGRGNEYNPMTTDAQGRPSYQPRRPSRDRGGREDEAPSTDIPSEAPPWWPPGMPWPPVPPQATPTPTPAPSPYGAPLPSAGGGVTPYYQSYGDLNQAAGLMRMRGGGMVRPSMTNAFTPGSYYATYNPFKRGVGGM